MVVLDTSALLYWTLDPTKLTSRAYQAIDNAPLIVVSSISIWEIGLKAKLGKLTLPLSMDNYLAQVRLLNHFELQPVTVEIWMQNLALDWKHRDPADRTIVATAMLLEAPLIASDRVIQLFYPRTVW